MDKKVSIISVVAIIFIFSIFINSTIGAYELPLLNLFDILFNPEQNLIQYQVLTEIRIPRVILGIFVGIAFGLSGVMMQTLFKNPLADPSIIGVSAGASAGVVIFMMLSSFFPAIFVSGILSYFSIPFSAFLGAVVTILLIYKLATVYNKVSVSVMLLAGIAINAVLGAIVGLFSYVSTEEELKSFTFWTMGSLANGDWSILAVFLPVVLITIGFAWVKRVELNLLLLGEDEAKNSGINTERLKKLLIVVVSLAIGVSVAYCGIIGFVGLVVPHIARLIVGANHKYLIPMSALLGPLVLFWADAIARVLISPAELPIGIITAILGAPFFLWLLIRNKQGMLS